MTKQVAAVMVVGFAFLAGGLFTGYTHFKRPTLPIRLCRGDTKEEVLRKLNTGYRWAEASIGWFVVPDPDSPRPSNQVDGTRLMAHIYDRDGTERMYYLDFDAVGLLVRARVSPVTQFRGTSTWSLADIDIDQ